jgi:hypothetical protein
MAAHVVRHNSKRGWKSWTRNVETGVALEDQIQTFNPESFRPRVGCLLADITKRDYRLGLAGLLEFISLRMGVAQLRESRIPLRDGCSP